MVHLLNTILKHIETSHNLQPEKKKTQQKKNNNSSCMLLDAHKSIPL